MGKYAPESPKEAPDPPLYDNPYKDISQPFLTISTHIRTRDLAPPPQKKGGRPSSMRQIASATRQRRDHPQRHLHAPQRWQKATPPTAAANAHAEVRHRNSQARSTSTSRTARKPQKTSNLPSKKHTDRRHKTRGRRAQPATHDPLRDAQDGKHRTESTKGNHQGKHRASSETASGNAFTKSVSCAKQEHGQGGTHKHTGSHTHETKAHARR